MPPKPVSFFCAWTVGKWSVTTAICVPPGTPSMASCLRGMCTARGSACAENLALGCLLRFKWSGARAPGAKPGIRFCWCVLTKRSSGGCAMAPKPAADAPV
eukprot:gene11037-gene8964